MLISRRPRILITITAHSTRHRRSRLYRSRGTFPGGTFPWNSAGLRFGLRCASSTRKVFCYQIIENEITFFENTLYPFSFYLFIRVCRQVKNASHFHFLKIFFLPRTKSMHGFIIVASIIIEASAVLFLGTWEVHDLELSRRTRHAMASTPDTVNVLAASQTPRESFPRIQTPCDPPRSRCAEAAGMSSNNKVFQGFQGRRSC